jgi:hypothetical protein
MRVLFDQATPVPIRSHLERHEVRTVAQEGWDRLKNGELLAVAEAAGFDVLLTTDKNIRHQQNLFRSGKSRSSFLGNNNGRKLRPYVRLVAEAVDAAVAGSYAEVDFPSDSGSEKAAAE